MSRTYPFVAASAASRAGAAAGTAPVARRWRQLATIFTVVSAFGCGSMNPSLPDRTEVSTPLDEQEANLEAKAAEYHAAFVKADLVLDDPELHAYLRERLSEVAVAAGIDPDEVDVAVIRNAFQNASALANGMVHLHVGILAQIENEAQLVVLLSHELSHYLHRHARSAQIQRAAAKSRADWAEFFLGLAGLASAGLVMVPLELSGFEDLDSIVEQQVQGYSREKEHEADVSGLRITIQLGYDSLHAARFFERLRDSALEDRKALNFDGERGVDDPYIYASHPLLLDRIASIEALRAERDANCASPSPDTTWACGVSPRETAGDFESVAGSAILEAAKIDRAIGRKQRAIRLLERLVTIHPDETDAWLRLGKLFADRGSRAADPERAIVALGRAVEVDPSLADAHRELGFLFEGVGRMKEARAAWTRYLELEPEALDRTLLEKRMKGAE